MKLFDTNFWIVMVLFVALGGVAWARGGTPLLQEACSDGLALFVRFVPLLLVSFLVAGLAERLVPHAWVARSLGEEAGIRGLLIASAAGIVTPAGPFVSMPLALALLRTGAAPPAVISFLSAWSLLALHRLVAWEIPILGAPFALTRWALCLVLPLVAGLLARLLLRVQPI